MIFINSKDDWNQTPNKGGHEGILHIVTAMAQGC